MAETDVTEDNYIASKDLPITFKVRNLKVKDWEVIVSL